MDTRDEIKLVVKIWLAGMGILVCMALLVSGVVSLSGCANTGIQRLDDMTDRQKAVLFSDVWAAQYDDYLLKQHMPLTEAERKVMRVQKKILEESRPWLDLFVGYAESGAMPPEEITRNLTRAILKLVELASGKEA